MAADFAHALRSVDDAATVHRSIGLAFLQYRLRIGSRFEFGTEKRAFPLRVRVHESHRCVSGESEAPARHGGNGV
jgi:hypothetical protein